MLPIGPRNTRMGYLINHGEWSLSLGPSDRVWIATKHERLGDKKITYYVGGEIQWYPCLFWPSDLVEIMVKLVITCSLFWPSDLVWIVVKPCFS